MDPSPIYVSSPGVLVDTSPSYQRLVYVTPTSTIAEHTVVRDATGRADAYPIIISTTNGALFRDGSYTYQITAPYSAFSYAAVTPTMMMHLAQPQPVQPAFTPSQQYISTAVEPTALRVESTTTVLGALINNAALFTTATPAAFLTASHSTLTLSTATLSTTTFRATTANPISTLTDYLSAATALISTATIYSATVANNATFQSSLTVGGLFSITSNASIRGPAVVTDLSAGAYFSTLQEAGIGGDLSGASWLSARFISAASGTATIAGLTQVSTATVGQTLSTLTATATNGIFQTLAVGRTPGTTSLFTLDISGAGQATAGTTVASLSTSFISAATATLSSINLINATSGVLDRLNIVGTTLQLNEVAYSGGGGGASCNYVGLTYTASNYLYTSTSIVSTLQVASTTTDAAYNAYIFGTAHTSSIRNTSNMIVAVGINRYAPPGAAGAPASPSTFESIYYSFDNALNWSPSRTGGFMVGNDVAWNGRMWVAVGEMGSINGTANHGTASSTIQYSLDGSNWRSINSGGFAAPVTNAAASRGYAGGTGIAWNGSIWVATGEGSNTTDFKSTIQFSTDGSNFFAANSATGFVDTGASNLNVTFRPTWNGRMWLAGRSATSNAGAGNTTNNACYSYDGSNWTTLSIPSIPGTVLNFTWNGNYWLAFGKNIPTSATGKPIAVSYNGLNWNVVTSFPYSINAGYTNVCPRGAAWNGRNWLCLSDAAEATRIFSRSYDNRTWSSNEFVGAIPSGTFNGTAPVAVPWNYLNTVNQNWPNTAGNIYYYNGIYYATGGSGAASATSTIVKSSNSTAWTGTRYPFSSVLTSGGVYKISALAFQSNIESDVSLPTLDINTGNYFKQYQSTNQIYSISSLITFNNTLFVDSTQQVAINTYGPLTSTMYQLYIDGSMLTYGAAKLGGATTWTVISDERVKTNITYADVSKCYYTVRDTHVHAYNFKPEYVATYGLKPDLQYGLYAQELETVLPKSVIETDVLGTKIKMIDPSQLNMIHYGASVHMYSTLGQNVSTFIGRNTTLNSYLTNTSYTNLESYINTNNSLQNSSNYLTNFANLFNSNYSAP